MHIAYVSFEFPKETGFGGIGTYVYNIASCLASKGHDIEVFTASFNSSYSYKENNFTVHRIKLHNYKDFPFVVVDKFLDIHQKNKFDLVECAENGAEALKIIENITDIPLVVRLHTPSSIVTKMQNYYTPFFIKLRYFLGALRRGKWDLGFWSNIDKNRFFDEEFILTNKAKLITAPSFAMKHTIVKWWNLKPDKIFVIPNIFIPYEKLLSIPIKTNSKRILFIGRLNVIKGCIALTHALKIVLKKRSDWKVIFIGKNEYSHTLRSDLKSWMAKQLIDFRENIEFIDWIDYDSLPFYLSNCDICVFPSLFESFSYTCVEAMAAGRAIVGSIKTAMAELLSEDCGLLIEPTKPAEIAKALLKYIDNENMRHFHASNARNKVIKNYSCEALYNQIIDTYKNII